MGTIVIRGKSFRAVVRLKGVPKPLTKTCATRKEAGIWITQTEAKITAGPRISRGLTLGHVLEKTRLRNLEKSYQAAGNEFLARFLRDSGNVDLAELTEDWWFDTVSGWDISPDSRLTYLSRAKGALTYAQAVCKPKIKIDWEALRAATTRLRVAGIIKKARGRTRRVTDAEIRLLKAAPYTGDLPLGDILEFAILTCMRRGEILRITWADLNEDAKGRPMQWIRDRKDPKEKIGNDQNIPLLGNAYEIIKRQPRVRLADGSLDPRIFPFPLSTLTQQSTITVRKAGLKNLHFHDLRHEGISRLFEAGYGIPEVCKVSGHKNWNTLRGYLHLSTSLHDGPIAHHQQQPAARRLRSVA